MKPLTLASLLLLTGVMRHYGWDLIPLDIHKPLVSKALGAGATLVLIWTLFHLHRSWVLLPVVAWWSFEEVLTVVCSVGYIFDPWPVPTGKAICSSVVEYDIGAATIVAVALLAYWLPVRSYRSQDANGNSN